MPAAALLTSEQYLSLPDEFDQNGNRIKDELIAGEVVRMPPPSRRHDLIKNQVKRIVDRYLDASHSELLCLVEIGAEVSRHDTFVPDVSIIRRDRVAVDERIFRGAPDLAIEVVSPTDTATHLKSKVDAYLQNGSKAVWVMFPDTRSVMAYSGDSVRELKGEQRLEDALLPGFSTPVSAFFELG